MINFAKRNLWMVPILAYHRVGEPKGDHVPTVTPEAFEQQLRAIQRFGYRAVEFGTLAEQLAANAPIDRRTVCITFDDGYEETCTIAGPLLRRAGFRATVFVTPDEVGKPGFLTWPQVVELARDGMTIGSHTMHHTYLPLVSLDQARSELLESKRILDAHLPTPVVSLSYPVGGYTIEVQALARAAGYRAACTTNRGYAKHPTDPFAIRRIKINERDRHPWLLRVKLSGYYDCFRRLQRPA